MITQERLKYLLHYDPIAGEFTWINPTKRGMRSSTRAGHINNEGYWHISIDNRTYRLSHLAWLYMEGYLPPHQIDHINKNQGDDRFSNLRPATPGQNRAHTRSSAKSGFKGVYTATQWAKLKNKWNAAITINKKRHHLGMFATPEEAHESYCRAAREAHGQFFHP